VTQVSSLTDIVVQLAGLIVIGALMMLFVRYFHFRSTGQSISSPRQSAVWALCAIGISLALVMALLLGNTGGGSGETPTSHTTQAASAGDVVGQLLVAVVAISPVLIVMKRRRETLRSTGVTSVNLGRAVLLSVVLIAALVTWCSLVSRRCDAATAVRTRGIWALLQFAIVGFAEEFAYRGYLQSRLIAWLGGNRGWVLASVIMAMAHVSHRVFSLQMTAGQALSGSAALIPVSLFLGFVMMKTKNIVAPGLVHTAINWLDL
jgi:membrane protease YdiL (CAAX protease family)